MLSYSRDRAKRPILYIDRTDSPRPRPPLLLFRLCFSRALNRNRFQTRSPPLSLQTLTPLDRGNHFYSSLRHSKKNKKLDIVIRSVWHRFCLVDAWRRIDTCSFQMPTRILVKLSTIFHIPSLCFFRTVSVSPAADGTTLQRARSSRLTARKSPPSRCCHSYRTSPLVRCLRSPFSS